MRSKHFHNFAASNPCDDPNPCDSTHGYCNVVDNQQQCSCQRGYELNADGSTCDDVDECSTGSAACTQLCTNTAGGYTCSCNDGYWLAVNEYDCNGVYDVHTYSCSFESHQSINIAFHIRSACFTLQPNKILFKMYFGVFTNFWLDLKFCSWFELFI